MRLRRLLIERYGNFERAELALDPRPGRINLVVAPNGAGKSVLRQAFHDLMFGIPMQSDMRFRFDYADMKLEADAVAEDGTAFGFGWSRRAKRSFTGADAQPRFEAALGKITPRQLEHLFALDTIGLREGGDELALGGDKLGLALLSGTGELSSARTLRLALEKRRDEGWERGKNARPLAKAAKALEAARLAANKAVQPPRHRATLEAAIADQAARKMTAEAGHRDALVASRRLARIDRTRHHLDALDTAAAWIMGNADAPVLRPELGDALSDSRSKASLAAAAHVQAREAMEAARARAASIERDEAALAEEAALAALAGGLGTAEKAARDIEARATERQRSMAQAAAVLRDIDAGLTMEQALATLPNVATRAAARAEITEHAARAAALAAAAKRLSEATHQLAAQDAEAKTEAPVVVDALVPVLREIRADRDPVRHRAEIETAHRRAMTQQQAAMARVPGWSGDADTLLALACEPEATFERLEQARAEAAASSRDAGAARDRLALERADWQRQLDGFRATDLPDEARLAASRSERDRGWRLIHRRAFTPDPPDAKAERAYAAEESLPLVFERHLRAADALADQRFADLERIKDAERVARSLESSTPGWEQACARDASASVAMERAARTWMTVCQPLGLGSEAMLPEAREFLSRRHLAIEAVQAARTAQGEFDALETAHAAWAERLARTLTEAPGKTLAELLALADARIKAASDADAARIKREARSQAARQAVTRAEQDHRDAQAAFDVWQGAWARTLAQLGRPAGESPAATEAVLQGLADLGEHLREATGFAERIADMERDNAVFTADVRRLAARLGVAVTDVFETARLLIDRRLVAQRQNSQWEEAQRAVKKAGETLARAERADRDATHALNAIVAACGANTAEEAERRIAEARERTRHEHMRDVAEAGLREHGESLSRQELRADAEAMPAHGMTEARAAAERTVAEARDTGQQAAVELSKLQAEFHAEAEATLPAEAAAAHASATAVFSRLLDDQLMLRVAATMLARAMEAVEENAGADGVRRISDAFAAVTGDAYGIVGGERDNGEVELMAVEHRYPHERKHIAELSEGTRDQLYLALRIVAIESQAASAARLPFIADDILQTFDDDRALAAFGALRSLSERVQVIVLTHHRHLRDLAGRLPEGSVHLQTL